MASRPFTPAPRHRARRAVRNRERRHRIRGAPVNLLLAIMPSVPRPILDRLTARMIDRLDEY